MYEVSCGHGQVVFTGSAFRGRPASGLEPVNS
jgi:hypothetical protein